MTACAQCLMPEEPGNRQKSGVKQWDIPGIPITLMLARIAEFGMLFAIPRHLEKYGQEIQGNYCR